MAALKEKGVALLGSSSGVNMQTGAAVTIYTTPVGKTTRISHAVIRDYTASLAGGTSYTITGLRAAFSLVNGTTANTGYMTVRCADLAESTEIAAATVVQFTPTTGSTAACTATIDIFGYQT